LLLRALVLIFCQSKLRYIPSRLIIAAYLNFLQ